MTVIQMAVAADAILKQICESAGLHPEDLKGRSQEPTVQYWRRRAYLEIIERKNWSARRTAHFMGKRNHMQVTRALPLARRERDNERKARTDPQFIHELEAQIRRLSGTNLALEVQHSLNIPLWQAIFLSILMETYPRVCAVSDACELYDEASERLSYGTSGGVSDDQARLFSSRINRHFPSIGLPKPVILANRALVLSDDIAPWLHNKFGKPVSLPSAQRMTG
ncbi:MAG: hypothetical protein CL583_13360 [Alteromonadaceae bacterium]|nr:hypothetical protein [Alteromonadaceae bacterium]|tara:strand:+ start:1346 stop:2017 length:672 start_codon:yes stop_codon:yes gene_type:complete